MIISKKELLVKAQKQGVSTIEFDTAKPDILLSKDIDGFLEFAAQKSSDVYYRYAYLSPSDFVINGETLSDASSEAKRLLEDLCPHLDDLDWYLDDLTAGESCENDPDYPGNVISFTKTEKSLCHEIISYNKTIDQSLLNRPIELLMFVILQGKTVGICAVDNWYENAESLYPASQALTDILQLHKEELENAQREREKKRTEAEERIKQFLVGNDDFFLCTNKPMRQRFGEQLWNRTEFSWLHPIFTGRFGNIDPAFFDILERVYKQNKNSR